MRREPSLCAARPLRYSAETTEPANREIDMPTDDRPPAAPVTFADGVLDRYRHVCVFTSNGRHDDDVLDAFVSQGLEAGDRLLYLVDPVESAAPVQRLRHLGYDAGELLAQHRCEIRTWTDTYLRTGRFELDDMLVQLEEMLPDRTLPRIRLVADMGWAASLTDDADDLIEFEARANFVHARHEHVVICSYDTQQFDGSFIIDVLRTHPIVLVGGVLQENPFFVPPAELLEERVRRNR